MKKLVLALLLLMPLALRAEMAQNSEIFTPETLSGGMSLESNGYRFEIIKSEEMNILLAKSPAGIKKEVKLPAAGFSRPERLFYVKSYGCGAESIDVVIQLAPEPDDDVKYRSYYRIILSKDMSLVVSEFFDPSVSTVNAVLPIQSVKGLGNIDGREKIICHGPKPVVAK